MENTTQLFLAVRFNCNKCHDHPFERWTQDQYYQTGRVLRPGRPARPTRRSGGQTDRRHGRRRRPSRSYEIIDDSRAGRGQARPHRRRSPPPKFPYASTHEAARRRATRREQLAAWITSTDNPYFAKSYVNRIWGYLLGVGIIEPIDDIRAGNPPTNPELLDHLTAGVRRAAASTCGTLMQLICKSRTYQLSVATNQWNEDDKINYSHAHRAAAAGRGAVRRRPPGDRLVVEVPGPAAGHAGRGAARLGRRAAERLPRRPSAARRARAPASASAPAACSSGPVMALVNGPTIADAIADPNNEIAKLVGRETDDAQAGRRAVPAHPEPARDAGRDRTPCLEAIAAIEADHRKLVARRWRSARPRSPLERPKQEKRARGGHRDGEGGAGRLREGARAEARRAGEAEGRRRSPSSTPTLKAYEATLAGKLAEWEKTQRRAVDVGAARSRRRSRRRNGRHADEGGRPARSSPPARTGKGDVHGRRRDRPEGHHGHPPGGAGRRAAAQKRARAARRTATSS